MGRPPPAERCRERGLRCGFDDGGQRFWFLRAAHARNQVPLAEHGASSSSYALLGVHAVGVIKPGATPATAAGECGHDGVYPLLVCGQPDVLSSRAF